MDVLGDRGVWLGCRPEVCIWEPALLWASSLLAAQLSPFSLIFLSIISSGPGGVYELEAGLGKIGKKHVSCSVQCFCWEKHDDACMGDGKAL